MDITFRVESSSDLGLGHVARCVGLAEELDKRGHRVSFTMSSESQKNISKTMALNFRLHLIETKILEDKSISNQIADARQTIAKSNCQLCILDIYAADKNWHDAALERDIKLIVFDDLDDKQIVAHIIINQNIKLDKNLYKKNSLSTCKILYGIEYMCLRNDILQMQIPKYQYKNDVTQIMISLGGGNNADSIIQIFQAMNDNFFGLINVLSTDDNEKKRLIDLNSNNFSFNFEVIFGSLDSSVYQYDTDLIIGAGGLSLWERIFLKIPSIIISISDNQRPYCEYLSHKGFINYIGHIDQFATYGRSELVRLVENFKDENPKKNVPETFIDGCGRSRVADQIELIDNSAP